MISARATDIKLGTFRSTADSAVAPWDSESVIATG
jgi:hypothetical protein